MMTPYLSVFQAVMFRLEFERSDSESDMVSESDDDALISTEIK